MYTTEWFRVRTATHRVEFHDWVIDGTPLRELFRAEDGRLPQEVTAARNPEVDPAFGRQALGALVPEPERPGDRIRMPDGRVPLLFCIACYDLGCSTLTTEIALGPETVEWRDIGWQDNNEPFDPAGRDRKPLTVAFERGQYESVLTELRRTLERIG